MQKWCIWYANGIDYEGITEADWLMAPAAGVLVVAAKYRTDEHRRTIGETYGGSDWYWLLDNEIVQSGLSTTERNHWIASPDVAPNLLKQGMWTSDKHYSDVITIATKWLL